MKLSAFLFSLTIVLFVVAMSSVCHAVQAPVCVITPDIHPEGKPWKAEDKLQYIEFTDEPLKNVLQSLSTGFGLKITVPTAVIERSATFRLKDVTYQEIISHILKDTEFEPVFQYPNVMIHIKEKTPN